MKSDHDFILLTSPPATGKTFWIKSFSRAVWPTPILFISPLRALANECQMKFARNVIVMTPEEWMNKRLPAEIVILDEFHLWFYWGDSFRERMWEAFYELAEASLVIGLTATMNEEMRSRLEIMSCHFSRITWCDFGNQKLRYLPQTYRVAPSKIWMRELIEMTPKKKETSLIFCPYRQEVFALKERLESLDFRVWSCVGGEANLLSLQVQTEAPPDFIIATSVLSHGVNLPVLSKIYFFYQISNVDFWIQMVARGGRRGESFQVFALEKPIELQWNPVTNFLAIQRISLKMKATSTLRQIQSWFLKESSSPVSRTKSAISS